MKKKTLIFILSGTAVFLVLAIVLALWLTGTFSAKNSDVNLADISGFERLVAKPSSIKVVFSDSYEGEFTVIDAEQINTIYESLTKQTYEQRRKDEDKAPGMNIRLTFVYADLTQVSFDPYWVRTKDGRIYSPKNSDQSLYKYLVEIGLLIGRIKSV